MSKPFNGKGGLKGVIKTGCSSGRQWEVLLPGNKSSRKKKIALHTAFVCCKQLALRGRLEPPPPPPLP